MIPPEHLSLWNNIQQFPLDDETAVVGFSGKLATEQGWTPAFTKRAVEEYRRFLLLCCISANGAAPSKPVDEVWHLHLTYTQSYWNDLCRNVLGRDLHHYPSAGGEAEDARHRNWYKDTLGLYRRTFDAEPPTDIWPPPAPAVRLPELPALNWKSGTGLGVIGLVVFPFIFIGINYDNFNPFGLSGPHFLVFLPMFGIALALAYILIHGEKKRKMEEMTATWFPADASAYQVASFLYGKHRAVQAGIVDLIKRGLLKLTGDKRFRVQKDRWSPKEKESNPLIPAFVAEEDGSTHSYDDIAGNWYDRGAFNHPVLEAMDQYAQQKEPFWQSTVFPGIFFSFVLIRLIQGFINNRPVGFLFGIGVLAFILFFVVFRFFSRKWVVHQKVEQLYGERLAGLDADFDRTVPMFALQGTTAIAGFAEGALLIGLFGAYQPTGWGASTGWGGGGGDSSSCSSGSSCGSSCGGGGCGGCSGS